MNSLLAASLPLAWIAVLIDAWEKRLAAIHGPGIYYVRPPVQYLPVVFALVYETLVSLHLARALWPLSTTTIVHFGIKGVHGLSALNYSLLILVPGRVG